MVANLLRGALLAVFMVVSAGTASAQDTGMIGEIRMFGGNFAPRGWAFCEGQLLPISQNSALFSILGTTYGGDGRTTFALPDLRGRAPVHPGTGPGLASHALGSRFGTETVNQVPAHSHSLQVSSGNATTASTSDALIANPSLGGAPTSDSPTTTARGFAPASDGSAVLSGASVTETGAPSVNVVGPRVGINYIIATTGIYPSRS